MSGTASIKAFILDEPQPAQLATQAACRDTDPEAFFPLGSSGGKTAKRVCRRCPVRALCLTWAMDAGMDHGIWGGLNEDERRELKRRRDAKTVTA